MSAPSGQTGPPDLTRLQRWFQAVITNPEGVEAAAESGEAQRLVDLPPGKLERVITRSRALSAAERLAIYANAYHSRLLECLGEVFPMLKHTLGEEAFDGLAFGYLQDYPSRSYTLNELGRHFPLYLEQTRPVDESELIDPAATEEDADVIENWPDFLIDLARLEWGIYEVFDGPGVEGVELLGANHLAGIAPEQWGDMKLIPVVCLQLLATRFPVNDYFTALRRAKPEEVLPIPQPVESFVALTRRNFVVRRYNLAKDEYQVLKALKEGQTIGQALALIEVEGEANLDRLAVNVREWFRSWTVGGFFSAATVPGYGKSASENW